MTKIFINYRHDDSEADAGRLYDHLSNVFNPEDIFHDHNSIEVGQNWKSRIDTALSKIDVFIAIINKNWLAMLDSDGKRRLDDPEDIVRYEIRQALKRQDIAFIPVLIGTTRMPKHEQLPEDIRSIADIKALTLLHNEFMENVKRLALIIAKRVNPIQKQDHGHNRGSEIVEEYNTWFKSTYGHKDDEQTIYWGSTKPFNAPKTLGHSHELAALIERLIVNADTDFWVKEEGALRPDDFHLRILKAVAISARLDHDFADELNLSDADYIREYLPELEGINSLWLTSDAYKITQEVASAFADVTSSNASKMTSEYWDDDPEVVEALHGRHWTAISHEEADKFSHSLMMFTPQVAKSYLPAFLTAALKKRGELGQIIFDTLSPYNELIPAKEEWVDELIKLLTPQQRQAVSLYMEWYGEELFVMPEPDEEKAVEFWKQQT